MRITASTLGIVGLLACSPCFAIPFLVGDQPYHCSSDQIRGSTYTINFAEFKDSGDAWCSEELTHALAQIDQARADNDKVVVLVYIHGWKNDANPDYSTDVAKFQKEVDRLSHILKQPGAAKAPPMVGIYLAWRGLTLTIEPFKTISYWPRRAVARHVGQKGMYDAVGQIVDRVGKERSRTTLIFVGHSFGARVLENAADAAGKNGKKPGFMRQHLELMRQRQIALRTNQTEPLKAPPLPPADMIIYVNAATASTVTRQTIQEWDQICKEGSDSAVCRTHPFWLAFTSTGDIATGLIMPIANAVFPALTSDGLHLLSAANTPWLHTHKVPEVECAVHQKPDDYQCGPGANADACFGGIRDGKKYCYEMTRVKPAEPAPPFWIMNVNKHVVKDHGDIWDNENVINLVLSVMYQQQGTINELRDQLRRANRAPQ